MMISATILDASLAPVFEYHTEIDQLRLMILAESREDRVRQKGATWAEGGVAHFGKACVDKFNAAQEQAPDLEKELTDTVMALWLYQSLFMGIKAESFMKTNLDLRISPDGTVQSTSQSIEE